MKSEIRPSGRRFWVVGGEYADTAFSRMVPGTETVIGPLESHDAALAEWRRLSESGRAECLRRYSIASE